MSGSLTSQTWVICTARASRSVPRLRPRPPGADDTQAMRSLASPCARRRSREMVGAVAPAEPSRKVRAVGSVHGSSGWKDEAGDASFPRMYPGRAPSKKNPGFDESLAGSVWQLGRTRHISNTSPMNGSSPRSGVPHVAPLNRRDASLPPWPARRRALPTRPCGRARPDARRASPKRLRHEEVDQPLGFPTRPDDPSRVPATGQGTRASTIELNYDLQSDFAERCSRSCAPSARWPATSASITACASFLFWPYSLSSTSPPTGRGMELAGQDGEPARAGTPQPARRARRVQSLDQGPRPVRSRSLPARHRSRRENCSHRPEARRVPEHRNIFFNGWLLSPRDMIEFRDGFKNKHVRVHFERATSCSSVPPDWILELGSRIATSTKWSRQEGRPLRWSASGRARRHDRLARRDGGVRQGRYRTISRSSFPPFAPLPPRR